MPCSRRFCRTVSSSHAAEGCQADIGEPPGFGEAQLFGIVEKALRSGGFPDVRLHVDELLDMVQKPGIDIGQSVDFIDRQAQLQGFADLKEAFGIGAAQALLELLEVVVADVRGRIRKTHTGRSPGSGWPSGALP